MGAAHDAPDTPAVVRRGDRVVTRIGGEEVMKVRTTGGVRVLADEPPRAVEASTDDTIFAARSPHTLLIRLGVASAVDVPLEVRGSGSFRVAGGRRRRVRVADEASMASGCVVESRLRVGESLNLTRRAGTRLAVPAGLVPDPTPCASYALLVVTLSCRATLRLRAAFAGTYVAPRRDPPCPRWRVTVAPP